MFGFCPLASGSKGNCIYVGSKTTRVLIDAGMSASMTIERLQEIGVMADTIQAILITHEHSDHIKGLITLSKMLKVPVLANAETAKAIVGQLGEKPKFKIFTTGELFQFGDLVINPFTIPHDTADPVGFTFQFEGMKLGICADLGHVTSMVKKHLEHCRHLYVEANHNKEWVHGSNRPKILKERILGKQGHLSNEECAGLVTSVYHAELEHIFLAHLSSECNREEEAMKVVKEAMQEKGQKCALSIAYQDKVSKQIFF